MGSKIILLLPSMVLHLTVTVALAAGVWFAAKNFRPQWKLSWQLAVLLGASLSLYVSANTLITVHQNGLLVAQYQADNPQVAANTGGGGRQADPAAQMKGDFLKTVDELANAPENITAENKKKIFDHFSPLFPKGQQDKAAYAKEILAVNGCAQAFLEDAMTAFKYKKTVKSEERERCEKLSGAFFNRERMITPEAVQENDGVISSIASHKPLTDSAGKTIEITEVMLKSKLDAQANRMAAIHRFFEDGPMPASAAAH